jgi:hypothetical protein
MYQVLDFSQPKDRSGSRDNTHDHCEYHKDGRKSNYNGNGRILPHRQDALDMHDNEQDMYGSQPNHDRETNHVRRDYIAPLQYTPMQYDMPYRHPLEQRFVENNTSNRAACSFPWWIMGIVLFIPVCLLVILILLIIHLNKK